MYTIIALTTDFDITDIFRIGGRFAGEHPIVTCVIVAVIILLLLRRFGMGPFRRRYSYNVHVPQPEVHVTVTDARQHHPQIIREIVILAPPAQMGTRPDCGILEQDINQSQQEIQYGKDDYPGA